MVYKLTYISIDTKIVRNDHWMRWNFVSGVSILLDVEAEPQPGIQTLGCTPIEYSN